jgi:molybdenum cofactor synthesis domain-containing protein
VSGPAAGSLRAAILVLSDKGSRGEREDLSGSALVRFLAENGCPEAALELLPDERGQIAERLRSWCDQGAFDLILTCGGTGVSPRDVTPEATREVITREIPGFGERMRAASLQKSSHAIISRALAGTRGGTLIINLPGSPRAAVENLEAVWPAVPHLIAKLQGDPDDCGAGSSG